MISRYARRPREFAHRAGAESTQPRWARRGRLEGTVALLPNTRQKKNLALPRAARPRLAAVALCHAAPAMDDTFTLTSIGNSFSAFVTGDHPLVDKEITAARWGGETPGLDFDGVILDGSRIEIDYVPTPNTPAMLALNAAMAIIRRRLATRRHRAPRWPRLALSLARRRTRQATEAWITTMLEETPAARTTHFCG